MDPTDRATARAWVAVLTTECDKLRRRIPGLAGKRLDVVLHQFAELNGA